MIESTVSPSANQTNSINSINSTECENKVLVQKSEIKIEDKLFKCSRFKNFSFEEAKIGCASTTEDWSGQYFAFNQDLSEGYAVDYLDHNGNGTVYMHKFSANETINCIEAKGNALVDLRESGEAKASLIKLALEGDGFYMGGEKLTTALDQAGFGYIGPCDNDTNDGDRREVVLGEKNITKLRLIETKAITYKWFEKQGDGVVLLTDGQFLDARGQNWV